MGYNNFNMLLENSTMSINSNITSDVIRKAILGRANALPVAPYFISLIFLGLIILIIIIVIYSCKKCNPRKGKLKKKKKNKDKETKRIGKSLHEILDELEANANDDDDTDDKFGSFAFKCLYDF